MVHCSDWGAIGGNGTAAGCVADGPAAEAGKLGGREGGAPSVRLQGHFLGVASWKGPHHCT